MKKNSQLSHMTRNTALEIMMNDYGDSVLSLVFLIVKDRTMAEDITQEVFLKAFRGWDSFRQESSMKTWLYRIAINESKKYLRSWSFRKIFSTLKKETPIETPREPSAEDALMGKIAKEDVARQLMAASVRYREILILHYYEDLSIKEVSQVLGISVKAVRTRLYRARQHFKAILKREGIPWT
ncbi:RNA polymerase [Paenibacillus jamilae]|uniref:RNA polymerase n=3 Tax=Paenibacillus TaxID=44249 RepID=A0ACC4ZV60_9BACL|nr:RNA polymerase [Paenibacillus sp. lzh-N1]KTS82233.1 RNA polymerase [Paenibacillus jamilae]QDY86433.1 sigma-70 family RNA polymerase sigma factor [Paenibacillus polymyxa]